MGHSGLGHMTRAHAPDTPLTVSRTRSPMRSPHRRPRQGAGARAPSAAGVVAGQRQPLCCVALLRHVHVHVYVHVHVVNVMLVCKCMCMYMCACTCVHVSRGGAVADDRAIAGHGGWCRRARTAAYVEEQPPVIRNARRLIKRGPPHQTRAAAKLLPTSSLTRTATDGAPSAPT